MSTFTKTLLVLACLVLCAGAGVGLLALKFLNEPPSSQSESTTFEVRPGESFKQISRRLEEQGLVTSATKLRIYARLMGLSQRVRVGEYAIRKDARPEELMTIVTSGKSIEYSITVQEGFNIFEIGDLLERQGMIKKSEFMALVQDPAFVKELLGEAHPSLEGYLFPETYHITKFTGAKGLIKMMVDRFKENYAKLQIASGWSLSRHQTVTLASIIEKETGAPEERAIISSVFWNRLKKKMRLQTDPTVIYGVWQKNGVWGGNIKRDDLLTPSKYNTYLNEGLPYGPISNPGLEALRATLAPAQTEFLFFVSRNNGTHIFSKEYSQHQKAVGQFQMDRKAREGKSWRDLQKRTAVPVSAPAATPSNKKSSAAKDQRKTR